MFHNIRYPPSLIPRDDLEVMSDILDWHGDHPHTNYHVAFDTLIKHGYFVEILNKDFTCFDANNYGKTFMLNESKLNQVDYICYF